VPGIPVSGLVQGRVTPMMSVENRPPNACFNPNHGKEIKRLSVGTVLRLGGSWNHAR
jgi:hypothetical protein